TAERRSLDDGIRKTLLAQAAKAKGMTVEELERSLANQAPPVTKADVDFIRAYEASKQKASESAAPGEARLEAAIRAARVEQMKEALLAEARAHAAIESHLAPPRGTLSIADAPMAASPSAPLRIAHFADFACPVC